MKLNLKRIALQPTYTIGRLYIDGEYFCDTIEDRVRKLEKASDKVYGQTAIPAGTYEVKMTYSNKYKKIMPQIMNVPYFEGIRIHAGNTAEDSLGCILLGENKVVGKVVNSRATVSKFLSRISGHKDITITIE